MTDTIVETEVELARRLIRAAVEERGADYVYEQPEGAFHGCEYLEYADREAHPDAPDHTIGTNPTGPACIVGHVLVAAGVPMWEIEACEGTGAWAALEEIGPFQRSAVRNALGAAQGVQDDGRTWGEALEAFEESLQQHPLPAPDFL